MENIMKYPLDSKYLNRKKKALKRSLLENSDQMLEKKIAILGGSTTSDIKDMMELFLLNYGIKPCFYESEYAQYWQDAMFDNAELVEFKPDVIFIHTNWRNVTQFPEISDTKEAVDALLENEYKRFEAMWLHLEKMYRCPVIQNNFDRPNYRLLGNRDVSDFHGRTNFLSRLNAMFYEFTQEHDWLYINDLDYLAADYGLEKWSNSYYWHMYKYCCCVDAIPSLAFSVARIIKALYGKNKKTFVLDLDNTLWGGVVGDDGVEGISVGPEVSMGQAYTEFQGYLKAHKDLGVLLTVNSKNDHDNAIAGLNHPDGVLKPDDFICIKANWENKDRNICEIADELNLGADSFVFVDDNPVERGIVEAQVPGVAVPAIDKVENYISILDHNGYFENVGLSKDDLKRNEMYKANAERRQLQQSFGDYNDYLKSLEMEAVIRPFEPIYMERIAQLTNKSNQFNLTTKRYTATELEELSNDRKNHICLYGKLKDKFGDNGVVSVVIGEKSDKSLHMRLWLMSCRVLKRNMENAMLDTIVETAREREIERILGYYYPTQKNGMVKDFYDRMGFSKISEDEDGNTTWQLVVSDYHQGNDVIQVIR